MGVAFDGYCYTNEAEAGLFASAKVGRVVGDGRIIIAAGDNGDGTLFYQFEDFTTLQLWPSTCDEPGSWPADSPIDPELIQLGALGMLSMWGIGIGIGLIISALRKMRNT